MNDISSNFIFSDNVQPLEVVWCMKTNDKLLHSGNGGNKPFLYQQFHFEMFYTNPLSATKPAIARIYNSLVEALNKYPHLPKYILVLPDKDVIKSINNWDYGTTTIIEKNLNWLIKQMAKAILSRRDDLHCKRPGSAPVDLPLIIWIPMITRPYTSNQELKRL